MAEELGLDPAPDAVRLEQAILRQDPSLTVEPVDAAATGSVSCPYLGLMPYDESDTEWFFGRSSETAHCLTLLSERGVLAVVGPSGSGKSSLVRAGVAAALVRDGRAVVSGSPGRRPMDLLGARTAPRAVVVVDQAEELFTVCDDPDERERFVHALAEHAEHAPVVLALRADRMGDASAHPAPAAIVERGLFVLGAITEAGLRKVIERPAEQSGLVVEHGLSDLLVREVEGEPGALPLLSHTLRETWVRREGRTLTVAGYRASGGVREAVAQTAEKLYAETPEPDRELFRELLMRLVTRLAAARLVTSDHETVQIAHESLVHAWPRLRGWLDDDVESQRILHHLVSAADAWDSLGRPASELYRGVRLGRGAGRQQAEMIRRLRARQLGARALVTPEPSQALLLAVAGVRLDDSPGTRNSLLGALARFPQLVDSLPMEGDAEVWRVAVHPTNGTVATYDLVHHVRLYDVEIGELLAEHQAGQERQEWDWRGWIAFSPDGKVLAVTTALTNRTPVELLDATTLEPLPTQPAGLRSLPWHSFDLAFDADGSHLVVLAGPVRPDGQDHPSAGRFAAVWRLAEPSRPQVLDVAETTRSLALSRDGGTLFTNDPLGRLDVASGRWTPFPLEGTRCTADSPCNLTTGCWRCRWDSRGARWPWSTPAQGVRSVAWSPTTTPQCSRCASAPRVATWSQ